MSVCAILLLSCGFILILLVLKRLFWIPKVPDLDGRHIIVTGGSSGIGKAAAIEAAQLGANVTIIARDVKKLETAKEEMIKNARNAEKQKINYISLDVTQSYNAIKSAISSIEDDVGPIYALITCAGMAVCGKIEDQTEDDFKQMINLNYFGTVFPIKAVVEEMKKRGEGYIVITGSIASVFGLFGLSAYCGSKFALRGLAESLYMELKPYNVSITLCLPPDTNTPGFENEQKSKPLETKLLSETAGLFQPNVVAHQMLSDTFSKKFFSTVGFDGYMVSTLCTGIGPLGTISDVIQQVSLMSLIRFITVFYILHFQRIIKQCKSNESSDKSERVKKEG